MSHFVDCIQTAPDDWTLRFICTNATDSACRWTSDCDCEEWIGMEIAEDGSSAIHAHFDKDGNEVEYAMVVGPCGVEVWFYNSEPRGGGLDLRPGLHEISAVWMGEGYTYAYRDETEGEE